MTAVNSKHSNDRPMTRRDVRPRTKEELEDGSGSLLVALLLHSSMKLKKVFPCRDSLDVKVFMTNISRAYAIILVVVNVSKRDRVFVSHYGRHFMNN